VTKSLAGKVAVVTGGSRGIGRAICLRLAGKGAKVVVNYAGNEAAAAETVRLVTEAGGEALAMKFDVADKDAVDAAFDQIKASGGQALAVSTDVSRRFQVEALANRAFSHFGRLDVWVNNAGISPAKG